MTASERKRHLAMLEAKREQLLTLCSKADRWASQAREYDRPLTEGERVAFSWLTEFARVEREIAKLKEGKK
jgi:hypothetical protein